MSTMRPLLVLLILQGRLSLLLVVEATCAVNNSIDEEEIVGALLDPKQYNKNHRPLNRWTGQAASNNSRNHQDCSAATDVLVNLHIVSFSTLSVQNMDFTVNIYLRMIWEDARLAYSASNPNASVSLHSMKDKIWMPDIFFRNAKQVENHADPVPNILVKLRPTGRIYFSQKLKVRLWCLMDLRDFPMDCQICRIELGAYGSSVSEVRFHWHRANVTFEDDALQIPEFSQPHVFVQSCTKSFSVTGEFACLRANVRLRWRLRFLPDEHLCPIHPDGVHQLDQLLDRRPGYSCPGHHRFPDSAGCGDAERRPR
ncbi:hypothetical protein BOX15_Mlig009716g1 [Macrostomum lignano]|uniref:Neurotransmitter-gated ion-channel ligand-binding domain-containing protein n=1 Tax=Macrostomum lignano TaxID=282301 RepID=A0A267DD37_9PLAT|nr:hypothetical protein BOX15_Mlig009716g1 [Macrostomum lignano]